MKRTLQLLAAVCLFCGHSVAATTTVAGTITGILGAAWQGEVHISASNSCTVGSATVALDSTLINVKSRDLGVLSVALQATDACTETGTHYDVRYVNKQGGGWSEEWSVPTSGTAVTIASVRTTSTSIAQTLGYSKITGCVAKGSGLFASGTSMGCLAVGTNNYLLIADSAQTYGVKWATLPAASLPATVVRTDQANTYSTGAQNFSSATSLTFPSGGATGNISGNAATVTNGVTAAASFGTDNYLVCSDGTGKGAKFCAATGTSSLGGVFAFDATNTRLTFGGAGLYASSGSMGFGPTAFTPSGTAYFYDAAVTTGVTVIKARAGAGQSTNDLVQLFDNDGTTKRVWITSGGGVATRNSSFTGYQDDGSTVNVYLSGNSAVPTLRMTNAGTITWSSTTGAAGTADLGLARSAAGVAKITNGSTGFSIADALGFRISGAAASGNYLRGNGTNFVSSAIQAGDIPDLSSTYQPLDAALTALAGGSDFVQFTGPTTTTKIFTLPNASSTLLYSGGALGTPSGGTLTNATGLPLSTGVTGILPGANGGTGNGFFAVTGPTTSLKTFTFPDASATILYSGGALGTPSGGTATNLTGLPLTTGVTGILPVANGGTGMAFFAAAGPTVARTYTFPDASATILYSGGALGTPSGGTLTNATGLPVGTGISGLGANVATFLGTPSSANLASALTDEVGNAGGFTRGTAGATNDCAKWDVSGNLVTAGAACSAGGLGDPGGNGVVVRTALNTTIARSVAAGTGIAVANGNGVSGNPTVSADFATVAGLAENNVFSGNNNFGMGTGDLSRLLVNDTGTGTTLYYLAKSQTDGAGSTEAVLYGTADTQLPFGVCSSGCGLSGNGTFAIAGRATCAFDGAITEGYYVKPSTGTAGKCTSAGATEPTSGVVLGKAMSSLGGAGNGTVLLDIRKAGGGSSSPLTTKGDLYGYSTADARVPVGTNNQILVADSADAEGVLWKTLTIPDSVWLQLAVRNGSSGNPVFAHRQTAGSYAYAEGSIGWARFADDVDLYGDFLWPVPTNWDGAAMTFKLYHKPGNSTGTGVRALIDVGCVADEDVFAFPATFNTQHAETLAVTAAVDRWQIHNITPAVTLFTNCAAGELMWIRLTRNAADSDVTDTFNGNWDVQGIEVRFARTVTLQ